jgi:hypothetical protein
MGREARRRVEAEFSREKHIDDLEEYLFNLTGRV